MSYTHDLITLITNADGTIRSLDRLSDDPEKYVHY